MQFCINTTTSWCAYIVKEELSNSSANVKMAYMMHYDDNKNINNTLIGDNQFIFGIILKRNLRGDNMIQTVTEIMTNK